ncbi:hypothetical protein L1987_59679 [Smallanthus sonchifolius]|uniref:Uncharacterized protein n=1 Tax=Smallanthus sonchifolius TaxID=185202 RepID=A0ACB9D661_9ASTR|nr:hypothetical protein L1987_59679 [Smallanthus sonchifolius]
MDPNAVVLEISSDEEGGWNDLAEKGIIDGDDDYNWISDILDEVNRDDCGYDDEVVLVGEVLPKKPRKKLTSNPVLDLDDDCVVLDHDPDKPPDVRKDSPTDQDQDEDDDSDDIIVVSEKGQVACRDYPHPRHLCIKFPFSSTPNQSHCDQCYCYVCDSLAPCIYWGNGSGCINHCLATDKIEFWVLERQNLKNVGKEVSAAPMNPVSQANQSLMLNPVQACPVTSSFRVGNIISQDRSPFVLSRNKYQPGLASQQLTRTSSCTIPGGRVHHSYNLSAPVHRPVFKRTVSDGFVPTTNRYSYSSYYKGDYRNQFTGSSQPNIVNASVPFTSRSNPPFDFPPNLQPLVNSDPYVEGPVLFQPNPVSLSSQAQGRSSLPNYTMPFEASRQESQGSTVDPKFFNGISWPPSQINQQSAAQSSLIQGMGSTNEPSLASGSGGLVDYEYDNWMFNHEARSMGGSGLFGLSELPSDPACMDPGTIFEF